VKIQEIITEDSDTKKELLKEFAGIRMFAEEQCQPYLQEIGGFDAAIIDYPMYRGIEKIEFPPGSHAKTVIVNQNRIPTDTPEGVQILIDDWFQERVGVRFRQTSLHCTGRFDIAISYSGMATGALIVIPMGEYHYAYSAQYRDLFVALGKFNYKPPNGGAGMSVHEAEQFYKARINEFMDSGDYRFDTNIRGAIFSGTEIMLSCKKALVIRQKFLKKLVEPE